MRLTGYAVREYPGPVGRRSRQPHAGGRARYFTAPTRKRWGGGTCTGGFGAGEGRIENADFGAAHGPRAGSEPDRGAIAAQRDRLASQVGERGRPTIPALRGSGGRSRAATRRPCVYKAARTLGFA